MNILDLSPREEIIVDMLLDGYDNKEIAKRTKRAARTIKSDFLRLYTRLGITGATHSKRVKLAVLAYRSRGDSRSQHSVKDIQKLSASKLRVLSLLTSGLSNEQIANVVGITTQGVKKSLFVIYETLGLSTREEIALWYESRVGSISESEMHYTQIELTCGDRRDVLWIPVPSGKAKVGEKITRKSIDSSFSEDWIISQVYITLLEKHLPPNAKKATDFHIESTKLTYMRI